ncbi:methyltransferase [Aureococcus anophagefferens]|nr:methyltransferase [Aureococcus anophagefferens]
MRLTLSAALLAVAVDGFASKRLPSLRQGVRVQDANAVTEVSFDGLDGSNARIGIIRTKWNPKVVDALSDGAKSACLDVGVLEENIFETQVPGAWELPSAARFLALSGRVDAIVCIGTLIKGETMHFEHISEAVASGLMSVQLQTSVPCTFGVLTVLDESQAAARSYAGENHGVSWGKTAVEMAVLRAEALGLAKKGTINLGFSEADTSKKLPGAAPEKKAVF